MVRGATLELLDITYDGLEDPITGFLTGGLGQLVDGKYVTSVPIISVEDADQKDGNIRPGHSLKDLKKPVTRKNSLIERLSRTGSARDITEPPRRY